MKRLFNILAVAAMVAGMASCAKIEQEDAFSTAPVAPELYAHNDILITTDTMDENVTFSWSSYRFLDEGLEYTLYASYDEDPVALATTKERYVTWTKAQFRELLYQKIHNLPDNDLFSLLLYVAVPNQGKQLKSAYVRVTVYAAGDAVAPEITEVMEDTVLDPTDPEALINVLSWEPARLVYGETVTYDVFVSILKPQIRVEDEDVDPVVKAKLTAEPIEATSLSVTVDALNEAVIAAGGVEAGENSVVFEVVAYCKSLPNGISTASVPAEITTYLATFADVLYMPGSYQGWDPATAATIKHSTAAKGLYQGIIDLTTADGADVEFKFSPVPKWEGDFGGKVEVKEGGSGDYATAEGTVGVSDNIKVPSGVYYIELNKKLNTIIMVQFESLSLIGSAVGNFSWSEDVDLEYDAEKKVFSAVTEFKTGEFKMRFNHDWTMSLGGDAETGYTLSGGNIAVEKDGEYKIEVNVDVVPFAIKFINTSFPDLLYVPGSHNGWDHSKTVLAGNGEGQYEGFASLGGEWGFKFTPAPNWDNGEWGFVKGSEPTEGEKGFMVYQLTDSDAGNIREGSEVTYGKVIVDLTTLTMQFQPITSVGIIGGFNGWAENYAEMTYDAAKDVWTAKEVEISKSVEWKFRMNNGWDVNLGGDIDNMVQDGPNIKLAESGIWNIELSIATLPYKATFTKAGESEEPELPETMNIIGEAVGGWDWATNAVEMIPVNGAPGQFWAIRYLEAGKGFKFCAVKEWNGDFYSLGADDSGFTTADGNCFVAENNVYMIYVDMANEKICIEPAKVYGIGNCFGGWDEAMDDALFQIDGDKVKAKVAATGEIRMYAASSIATTAWWTREFVFFDGVIAYRGNGGDQDRVTVNKGQEVIIDFNAGTVEVTGEGEAAELPTTMNIIGTAVGGWDWAVNAVEMIPVNGKPGQFWAIRYIEANQGFKFCAQKAWSGDFSKLGENTGFDFDNDGNCIVATSGVYMIYVDVDNDKICIEPAKVYGIGDCFGGWTGDPVLFAIDGEKVVGTTQAEGAIRMYAASSIATTDWWTREFVFYNGKIAYRGNGGDQEAVNVDAGTKVILDFNAGTATTEAAAAEGEPITIDGNFTDWDAVTTVYESIGNRFKGWKYVSTEKNLYFFYHIDASKIKSDGSSKIYIGFDMDKDSTTGSQGEYGGAGTSGSFNITESGLEALAYFYPWDGTTAVLSGELDDSYVQCPVGTNTGKVTIAGKVDGGSAYIELSIPKTALGSPAEGTSVIVNHAMQYYPTGRTEIIL